MNFHGATMTKNVRRVGVPATKKGAENPEYVRSIFDGPTAERLQKAQGAFTIGDDKQGTRIYHFHDSTLDRLYSRLARQAKGRGEEDGIRQEYAALLKYRVHWHNGGLEPSIGSVDLNRIFASDPASMSGMPKSERQAFHRQMYRKAVEELGWKERILLENVVCAEQELKIAGWSIGRFVTRRDAREGAQKILRECARRLAKLWGI
jgi:hypothetical protein